METSREELGHQGSLQEKITAMASGSEGVWSTVAFGVTTTTEPILALLHKSAYSFEGLMRIVVIGGDSGSGSAANLVLEVGRCYLDSYLGST